MPDFLNKFPQNKALDFGGRSLTYRDLDLYSDALTAFLQTEGALKPGASLAVPYVPVPAFWITFLAAMKGGFHLDVLCIDIEKNDVDLRNALFAVRPSWLVMPEAQKNLFRKHTGLLDGSRIILWHEFDFIWPLRTAALKTLWGLLGTGVGSFKHAFQDTLDAHGFVFEHVTFLQALKQGHRAPLQLLSASSRVRFLVGTPPHLGPSLHFNLGSPWPDLDSGSAAPIPPVLRPFELARAPQSLQTIPDDFLWCYSQLSNGIQLILQPTWEPQGVAARRHPHAIGAPPSASAPTPF